jgi:hypothetical protein
MADVASARAGRGRLIAARVLTVLGVILAIVTILAGYLRWQAFDNETFSDTAEELIANPTIRSRVASRLTEDLFTRVDVAAEIAARLPEEQKGLALPLASAIQTGGARVAEELLTRPRVQELWVAAATQAQRQLERVLDDDTGAVSTENGKVVLDLRPIVIQLGDQVAIIGNLAQKLPDDTGRIEIVDADRLELAQDLTRLFKAVAAWIWILPLALWAAAIWLARGRRRIELRAIAIGAILAGVLVLALRGVGGSYIVNDLTPRESGKPAVQATWDIVTSLLADGAWSLVLLGAVALLGVWLAGPSRSATWARGQLAPVFARWELTYGIVAAGLLLLVWWGPIVQTRRWLYMVVFTALLVAGVEVLRRAVARLPSPSAPTAQRP